MLAAKLARVGFGPHSGFYPSHYKKRPKTAESELILCDFLHFGTISPWKKIKGGIINNTNTTHKHEYQYRNTM